MRWSETCRVGKIGWRYTVARSSKHSWQPSFWFISWHYSSPMRSFLEPRSMMSLSDWQRLKSNCSNRKWRRVSLLKRSRIPPLSQYRSKLERKRNQTRCSWLRPRRNFKERLFIVWIKRLVPLTKNRKQRRRHPKSLSCSQITVTLQRPLKHLHVTRSMGPITQTISRLAVQILSAIKSIWPIALPWSCLCATLY